MAEEWTTVSKRKIQKKLKPQEVSLPRYQAGRITYKSELGDVSKVQTKELSFTFDPETGTLTWYHGNEQPEYHTLDDTRSWVVGGKAKEFIYTIENISPQEATINRYLSKNGSKGALVAIETYQVKSDK